MRKAAEQPAEQVNEQREFGNFDYIYTPGRGAVPPNDTANRRYTKHYGAIFVLLCRKHVTCKASPFLRACIRT